VAALNPLRGSLLFPPAARPHEAAREVSIAALSPSSTLLKIWPSYIATNIHFCYLSEVFQTALRPPRAHRSLCNPTSEVARIFSTVTRARTIHSELLGASTLPWILMAASCGMLRDSLRDVHVSRNTLHVHARSPTGSHDDDIGHQKGAKHAVYGVEIVIVETAAAAAATGGG